MLLYCAYLLNNNEEEEGEMASRDRVKVVLVEVVGVVLHKGKTYATLYSIHYLFKIKLF